MKVLLPIPKMTHASVNIGSLQELFTHILTGPFNINLNGIKDLGHSSMSKNGLSIIESCFIFTFGGSDVIHKVCWNLE